MFKFAWSSFIWILEGEVIYLESGVEFISRFSSRHTLILSILSKKLFLFQESIMLVLDLWWNEGESMGGIWTFLAFRYFGFIISKLVAAIFSFPKLGDLSSLDIILWALLDILEVLSSLTEGWIIFSLHWRSISSFVLFLAFLLFSDSVLFAFISCDWRAFEIWSLLKAILALS